MSNVKRWEQFRSVPEAAQKKILGGRLKGFTDINPVWRLKMLTEAYGECGIGWKYEITSKQMAEGANGEVAAFVDVMLYIKEGDVWSEGIPGTGGSMFIAKENSGLRTSDEAYKMALTDALSVACKALGVGADVYWEADTKYTSNKGNETSDKIARAKEKDVKALIELAKKKGQDVDVLKKAARKSYRTDDLRMLSQDALKKLTERIKTLPDVDIFEGTPFEMKGEK